MSDVTTYNVITGGPVQPGFDHDQVMQSFAALFKVPVDKAGALLANPRVVKKGLDERGAASFKQRLEQIGLVVTIKAVTPAPAAGGLSLAPIEGEQPAAVSQPEAADGPARFEAKDIGQAPAPAPATNTVAAMARPRSQETRAEGPTASPASVAAEPGLPPVSLAAGLGVAIGGALLWSLIASSFGYELGIVAWGIGAAIGLAVALTGGSGQKAGVVSAGLALVAILGGKFLFYDSIKDDLLGLLDGEVAAELQAVFEQEKRIATQYEAVQYDPDGVRQFLVDQGYSEAFVAEDVSDEEVAWFNENIQPQLSTLQYAPDFETWYRDTMAMELADVSTLDMLLEDFGLLSVIFLLLGISSAFRLGHGPMG